MYSAEIRCFFRPKELKDCIRAEKRIKSTRGSYSVTEEKDHLCFNVKASDAVALRATVASVTQLIAVFEKAHKIKNGKEKN